MGFSGSANTIARFVTAATRALTNFGDVQASTAFTLTDIVLPTAGGAATAKVARLALRENAAREAAAIAGVNACSARRSAKSIDVLRRSAGCELFVPSD